MDERSSAAHGEGGVSRSASDAANDAVGKMRSETNAEPGPKKNPVSSTTEYELRHQLTKKGRADVVHVTAWRRSRCSRFGR
jgi:hypothetical protein